MFMLAGLMGVLLAGFAVDFTIASGTRDDADIDDDNAPSPADTSSDDDETGFIEPHRPLTELVFDEPSPLEDDAAGGDPSVGATETGLAGPAPDLGETVLNWWEGGADDDVLMGGDGADGLRGHDGDDDLRGGLGNDVIHGGGGNDWVQGDGAYGAGGDDLILGEAGNNSLSGQGGNDVIHGGAGSDTILGGDGDDLLFGDEGDDWLSGNAGNDTLVSGGGADDLDGGEGDDLLIGGDDPERAWLHGGAGDDTLMPGAGDFVEGLAGADTFILRGPVSEVPVIGDYQSHEDRLELHLPADMVDDPQIDLHQDHDGSMVIRVNGEAVGRLLVADGLRVEDIAVIRGRA